MTQIPDMEFVKLLDSLIRYQTSIMIIYFKKTFIFFNSNYKNLFQNSFFFMLSVIAYIFINLMTPILHNFISIFLFYL